MRAGLELWAQWAGLGLVVVDDGSEPAGSVRATRQLIRLGIDTSERAGWLHNRGLRIYGGNQPFDERAEPSADSLHGPPLAEKFW